MKRTNASVLEEIDVKKRLLHGCLKLLFTDFVAKTLYFTLQKAGNTVQIVKNVELSSFQPILQKPVTFVKSLFT